MPGRDTRLNLTDRRQFLKAAGGVGVAGILAGCSGGGGGGSDGGSTTTSGGASTTTSMQTTSGGGSTTSGGSASASTELAVAHYPAIADTVPFQVGISEGIYEKHGVKVTDVSSFSGGGTTVRGIVTGGIGLGGSALPALVQGYESGAPIYVSGVEVATPNIDFHTLPDSDIEKIQDLKGGGTIAVSNPGSSSEACAIASVKGADGITLDDVEIKYAGGLGEAITAFEKGAADVGWSTVPKSVSLVENGESRQVWRAADYAPNITQMVLAVGGNVKQDNPDLAKNLLAAHIEAQEWVKGNVQAAAKVWAKNADISEDLAVKSLNEINPDKTFNIELSQDILQSTGQTMIDQGLIEEQPPWKEIAWQDPLPADKQVDWLK